MEKKISFVAMLILLTLGWAGACMGQPGFVLRVRDYRNERILLQLPISSREMIYLRTNHSLALTPYTHIYKVDEDGNLILSGAIFESGGGGFPEAGDGVLSFVKGKFRMDQINRFVGTLRFRVSPLSQETLVISHREFFLYQLVPEGTLVEIKVFKEGVDFDQAIE